MRNTRSIIIFLLFIGSTIQLFGQDTMRLVMIDSIQIIDLLDKSVHSVSIKENHTGRGILQAVENQSFATIRSGGPSVISTILNRGMASRHMAILWGGFNIQSVVNGTFDLGLIRNTFDEVRFYAKGTTPSTGNASMAGAISLQNNDLQNNGTQILLSTTSTKNISAALINKFRLKNYQHHFALNRTHDKNEYAYKNGDVQLVQKSAEFSMWSLNYEGHCLISNQLTLTGGVWLQHAYRNIPPTKTAVNQVQEQEDVNYRSFIHGTYYPSNNLKIILRGAYFDEQLDYQTPGITSVASSKVVNSSLDLIHNAGIGLSAQYRKDKVTASFFVPTNTRNTFGLLANYSTSIFRDWGLTFSVRPEWVNRHIQPLSLGLRIHKNIIDHLDASLSYNKGYTLPSFNDLYWPDGGNPDLKTERSHEIELGFKLDYGSLASKTLSFNLYLNLIDDWIQWMPIEGFFQPVNQKKVRNMGFELKLEESFQISQTGLLKVRMMYGFTDSRSVKNYLDQENEGKRSIFVPRHKCNGQISWLQKSWKFHLEPLFYSRRYDTVDNSTFVPGYLVVDFEAEKTFKIKKSEFAVSCALENLFNNDYENIKFYPMPLRIFRLGVNINL